MAALLGIGWIAGIECGCFGRAERQPLENNAFKGLFSQPFRNFGRLDQSSRLTAAAAALALRDAGITCEPDRRQGIGIVGASREGSLSTDLLYFKDYLDCGRTLARGNLFIYTLPSSPLGETAIHFGLAGPLFYATANEAPLRTAISLAEEAIRSDEAETMLAGTVERESAVYLVLSRMGPGNVPGGLDAARATLDKGLALEETIRELRKLKG